MAESARPAALFADGQPVPVAGLDAAVGDDGVPERVDGPCEGPRPGRRGSLRVVNGSRARFSDLQWLEMLVRFEPLWDLALEFDAILDAAAANRAGRRREYTTFAVVLFEVAAWTFGSYQRTEANLSDRRLWAALRAAAEAAYPHDERKRLPAEPISRSQNYRFRTRYATGHLLSVMLRRIASAAVEAAQQMGMLPAGASLTNPDKRSFVTGDGTWVPALTKRTRQDVTDPDTGEITGRYDPDALAYHNNHGKAARSPGMQVVSLLARNPHPNERIVLSFGVKSAATPGMARNDATAATDMTLDLLARHPEVRDSIAGLVYDMALSTAQQDRLLDAGMIPVCKVALTSRSRHPAQPLGSHAFTTPGGGRADIAVTAVAGTPCVTLTDGDGVEQYLPLQLTQIKKEPRKGRPLITTRWTIPTHPLAAVHLHGAVCRVRHTRTAAETRTGHTRSRALRVIPPSDARFNTIFGLREDTESLNADHKNRLWNRRSRTIGHNSVEFNTLAYQIHILVTALCAYQHRTGTNLTRWFGQDPPARAGPLPQAA